MQSVNPTIAKVLQIPKEKLQGIHDRISKQASTCTDPNFRDFIQGRVIRELADLINEGERNGSPKGNQVPAQAR
jgi:hypothetical protein